MIANCVESGTSEQRCLVCKATQAKKGTEPSGYDYDQWKITREATWAQDGK